jgi:hypothetical protein
MQRTRQVREYSTPPCSLGAGNPRASINRPLSKVLASSGRRRPKHTLKDVTATGGVRVPQDEVPMVAASLLVRPTELAARFWAIRRATPGRAGPARLPSRLADLRLVRMTRQDREPHCFLTVLGEQHSQATAAGDSEMAGRLACPEQHRSDLLTTLAHEVHSPLTAARSSFGLLLDQSVQPPPELLEQPLQAMSGRLHLNLGCPICVCGDHRRLERAVIKPFLNAHKFSSRASPIRVRGRQAHPQVPRMLAITHALTLPAVGPPREDRA